MEYVTIPGTDLTASRVGLGTWAIGGRLWGGTDEGDSIRAIQRAVEKGITLIDTAPVYGYGLSEELVGKAIRGLDRDALVVATKLGLEWQENRVYRNSTRERIRQEVEDSLRRLGVEVIDLYQIHWPDPLEPFQDTADEMGKLVEEGKIRAVGVSNYMPDQMEQFAGGADLATCQSPYNLFERGIEGDVIPFCRKRGIALLAYGALCRGLLSGRMNRDTEFEGDDIRKWDPKFLPPRFDHYLEAVQRLDEFARANYGKGVLALAVRWILDRGAEMALWGARRPDQIEAVDEVFGWSLDEGALKEIEGIVAETVTDPVGPEFMAPPARE